MKKLLFILIAVCAVYSGSAQNWATSGTKTRFTKGLGIPVVTDTLPGTPADTAQIIMLSPDSTIYYKYKGFWRPFMFKGAGDLVPYFGANSRVDLGSYRMKADAYDLAIPGVSADSIGRMRWNADDLTMNIGLTPNVILQTGQEMLVLVKNKTGTTIPNGTVVRQSGVVGASGRLKVEPFLANGTHNSNQVLGVTTEDIPNGADGFVASFGKVRSLNTATWPDSTILYASPTVAGGLTSTVPEAPNNIVKIGTVINSSSSNGILFVRVIPGSNIHQDEGVQLINPVDKSLLVYDSVSTLWKNGTLASVGGIRVQDTAAMLSGYNLQRVTNLGSTTTQNITANSFSLPASGNAITTDGSSMYIKAGNGNIYIGRDNVVKAEPDGKLTALSFIKTGGTSSQFLKADGSVDGNSYIAGSAISGTTNYIPKFTSAPVLANSQLFDNGTNVGIGTSSPNRKFEVSVTNANGTSIPLRITNSAIPSPTNEQGVKMEFVNDNRYTTSSSSSAIESLTTNHLNGAADLRFLTNNGTSLTEIMRLTSGGNVVAGSFVKSGGTSSQFLKADGSVDGNTYATTSSLGSYAYRSSGLAELSGATFTGNIAINKTSPNLTFQGGYTADAALFLNSTPEFYITDNATATKGFKTNISTGAFTQLGTGAFTLSGALSGTTASFSGNISVSSTSNSFIVLDNTTATTGKQWRVSSASNGNFFITQVGVVDAIKLNEGTGAATFSSLAGTGDRVVVANSSGTLSTSSALPLSGTYTPTFTNTANVTASALEQATYTRVGNVTTVFVCGQLTPTAANTQTLLHLTLPQSTSFSASQSYIGTGTIYDISNETNSSGNVSISSSDTTKAFIRCYPTSTNPVKFSFTFQYIN